MIATRYLVNALEESIQFYTKQLGFTLQQQFGPAMAILEMNGGKLWLAAASSSAAQITLDGKQPLPGGWNRIVISVPKLDAEKIRFLYGIESGPGGRRALCEDPSKNLIELVESL